MDNLSSYESRIGKVSSGSKEIFTFVTDMRNFSRFLPGDVIENWEASADECSFEVTPVGKAKVGIVQKDQFHTIKYTGYGLNNTEFFLWIQLKEVKEKDTRVKITIKADLNPGLKMIASKPINKFLDKLVSGMEEFEDWAKTGE
ncbi:MAG: SRPBCC family protein [Bacteroidales bacterium]|jgi:carbon monoxide dehydrogenase subunit G|nr:SRPBCC family protein [Bacteroidales bacterium]